MRAALLVPLFLALGSCDARVVDCVKIDFATVDRCFQENRAKGDAAKVVACMPFSERISTEGYWVVGFEKNDFFEGSAPPPEKLLWSGSTGADLIVDEKPFKVPEEPQAFEVDVVGRRALCPMSLINAYPIAVEQIHVRRRIG